MSVWPFRRTSHPWRDRERRQSKTQPSSPGLEDALLQNSQYHQKCSAHSAWGRKSDFILSSSTREKKVSSKQLHHNTSCIVQSRLEAKKGLLRSTEQCPRCSNITFQWVCFATDLQSRQGKPVIMLLNYTKWQRLYIYNKADNILRHSS